MKLQKSSILLAIFCATLLAVCLGGCGSSTAASSPSSPTTPPTPAISFDAPVAGVTPYISFVTAHGASLAQIKEIDYTIATKPGLVSKPVSVSYSIDYLIRRGYAKSGEQAVTIPVFGLYESYHNDVAIKVVFEDNSSTTLPIQIATKVNSSRDENVYSRPVIKQARAPGSSLGFDFFYLESLLGTPVVVDTDGEVRWIGSGTMNSQSSLFFNNGFLVGTTSLYRFELDGTITSTPLVSPDPSIIYQGFHHTIEPGKTGLFVDLFTFVNGEFTNQSLLAEMDSTGNVISNWDFNTIISDYMQSHGDDPSTFVYRSLDWFHLNSAIYDPSDDSIIASSRENFVIKIDYKTGNIIWIFGDPTKYWHTFPSLAAKSIVLNGDGSYPIGQHALSFTRDGLLLMFNNGMQSIYQPGGVPAGATLPYSIVAAYSIDGNSRTARQAWQYAQKNDQGKYYPPPDLCSSVYQSGDGSTLINYAVWPAAIKTQPRQITFVTVVGLDSARTPVFEFQYINGSFCTTSWAAQPLPFEALSFK